jgi:hypothetical protein
MQLHGEFSANATVQYQFSGKSGLLRGQPELECVVWEFDPVPENRP